MNESNYFKGIIIAIFFNFFYRLKYYGQNSIEVEVKSYARLFVEEILTPFYIFQIAACILWMVDQYYYYAFCIIVISLISMILSLVETKRVNN
jgi:magnesium-transporting ATPase (P-type)